MATINKQMKSFSRPEGNDTVKYEIYDEAARNALPGKADKITGGVEDNFVSIDENGNPKDSGHKASDFVTDVSGKADKVSGATSGDFASLDENGNLQDSGYSVDDISTDATKLWSAQKVNTVASGLMSAIQQKADIIRDIVQNVAVASVPDATTAPLTALTVAIEPIQSGSGDPYPAGGSRNKLNSVTANALDYGGNYTNYTINDSTGVVTITNGASMGFLVPVTPNGQYVFSYVKSSTEAVNTRVREYSAKPTSWTDNFIEQSVNESNAVSGRVSKAFTVGASTNYIICSIYHGSSATNLAISEWQCESGSSATTFTPYENKRPITGRTAVAVTATGKNLFDASSADYKPGYYLFTNDQEVSNAKYKYTQKYFKLKPSTTYVIQYDKTISDSLGCYVSLYDVDKQYLARISVTGMTGTGAVSGSFTTTAETVYARFSIPYRSSDGGETNIMLEEGTTASAYVPFGSTHTAQLGQTVYGGYIDWVQGQMVIDGFLYVYDGTEPFQKSGTALNGFYNNLSQGTVPHEWAYMLNYNSTGTAITNEASSMFKMTRDVNTYKTNYGYCYLDSGMNFDADPDIFGTTTTSFANKLHDLYEAGTPLTVFAKLATPITVPLENLDVIQPSATGQFNLWADSGDVLLMEYPCDTKLYIDKKLAELTALILENG